MSTEAQLVERLERMERRLEDLTSVQEIEKLQNQYVTDLHGPELGRRRERLRGGCRLRHPQPRTPPGRENIAAMFSTDLEDVVKSRDGYILSSPSITVNGDSAYGEWTWHRFQCEFRTSFGMMRVWGPWSEGHYKCHYQRIDGVWKIKDLWFRVNRPDTDEEIAAVLEGQVIGGGFTAVGAAAR